MSDIIWAWVILGGNTGWVLAAEKVKASKLEVGAAIWYGLFIAVLFPFLFVFRWLPMGLKCTWRALCEAGRALRDGLMYWLRKPPP